MQSRDRELLIDAIDLLEDAYSYLVNTGLGIAGDINEYLDRACRATGAPRWPRDSSGKYSPLGGNSDTE
ncbi:MAG: hypothetical protein MOGMAGMI_02370 [Candidatus Omnitrophica bacterium]|nr:hypothetical protein [Candidatus Omnitrophota bacterium]